MYHECAFIQRDGKIIPIGILLTNTNEKYMNLAKSYINETCTIDPIFINQYQKSYIKNNPEYKPGIYVFENKSVYRKTENKRIYTFSTVNEVEMKKLGKFGVIERDIEFGSEDVKDTIGSKELDIQTNFFPLFDDK